MAAPRQRSGLGRGLGDLIRPTTPELTTDDPGTPTVAPHQSKELVEAPAGAAFAEIAVDRITPKSNFESGFRESRNL